MDGTTVQGFETGIQVGNQVSGNTTVADVKNSVITGNGTGVLVNDGATLTVHNSDLSGNTPTGVNNARTDQTAPVDATANWWGSASCPVSPYIVGNVTVGTCAAALVTGPDDVYTRDRGDRNAGHEGHRHWPLRRAVRRESHTERIGLRRWHETQCWHRGSYDWDWTKTYPGKDFAALRSRRPGRPHWPRRCGTIRTRRPRTLVNGKLATWEYTCTGVGTSPLVYDTSVGTGSYLSDKNGFPMGAVWLGDSIMCVWRPPARWKGISSFKVVSRIRTLRHGMALR